MLPHNIQLATFTLKRQGNQQPCLTRSQGSHCSVGTWRCKPVGSVPPATVLQNWTQAPELQLHAGSVLLSQQQHREPKFPKARVRNQAPKLPQPAGSVFPSGQQSHRTALPEAHVGNQALEYPLPAGSVLLTRQQCHWPKLPEAHVRNQAPKLPLPAWFF
jgi:hypothetical protein